MYYVYAGNDRIEISDVPKHGSNLLLLTSSKSEAQSWIQENIIKGLLKEISDLKSDNVVLAEQLTEQQKERV